NYWRDGVRAIDEETYHLISSKATPNKVSEQKTAYISDKTGGDFQDSLESFSEGEKSKRYVTTYERNPKYRKQAIAIHGNSCAACGFNFGNFYGEYAEGFIHVHHIIPVSEFDTPKDIDPETDLIPLCANCHSVVHRKKDKTLSILEIKNLIADNSL
ncbi:HNH endonuclease, partial [Psychrobacter sp. AOP31-E1-50]